MMNLRWITPVVSAVAVSAFLVAVGGLSAPASAELQATRLRVEFRDQALGVDVASPRLSWEDVETDPAVRGQMQTAYQILVASKPELLSQGKGDLWDSGKVSTAEGTHLIAYSGSALKSEQPCYWQVKLWDKDQKETKWSSPAVWSMGLLQKSDWKARWIGASDIQLKAGKLPYLPALQMRRAFQTKPAVSRAMLYVTAAGLYEMSINGTRVGADYFTPGWTTYDKRLYYQTYDVTSLIKPDTANAMGAILGDGWYGLHHHGRNRLGLLAQLRIEYTDGSSELVATDDSWKATAAGPVLNSDMYQGETYDARKEITGWDAPGFDDSQWSRVQDPTVAPPTQLADVTEKLQALVKDDSVSVKKFNDVFGDPAVNSVKTLEVDFTTDGRTHHVSAAEGKSFRASGKGLVINKATYGVRNDSTGIFQAVLQAHPGVPVQQTGEIKPVTLEEPKPGNFVYDLGQNFTGIARLKITQPAGTKITLRFAEMLNPDRTIYTTNLRAAACTDVYLCKGNPAGETWQPRFTFHGFRYIELTGVSAKPPMDAVTGIVLGSVAPFTSSFECSNPLLNKLQHNIVWGQRSNYVEVPTDCPQRDERRGWSGDAQAFIPTGTYNQDLSAFFTAWMQTFNDTQYPDGSYPNTAPLGQGTSPGWGDAGVICPWTLYQMYGDTRVLSDHYANMVRWIDYMHARTKNLLRPSEGFGDWLNLDKKETPKDLIATAYFYRSTSLMAEIATVLGKTDDAAKYHQLAEDIKAAFQKAYISPDGHIKGENQTGYLLSLGFHLMPEDLRPQAGKYLEQLIADRNYHLSTGFLGVNLLLPTLTRMGQLGTAYRLLQNDTYPSWGYPITQGATTVWERWDGWTDTKGFQDPGMNSFNHYAYGSCGQWMFSTLAGIAPGSPGFGKIEIHPQPGGGITHAKASYHCIRGLIETEWNTTDTGAELQVTIPANTSAVVYVPNPKGGAVTESGKPAASADGCKYLRKEGNADVFEVTAGHYDFKAS